MKIYLTYLIIFCMLESCASNKILYNKTGGREEAIQNAITDFSNTNKIRKDDSVFLVTFYDTIYRMVLESVDSNNARWVRGEIINNIVAVDILGANGFQFLLTKNSKIGSKGKLPSRVFKKNGKLFYWWNDDNALTEETLEMLKQYHLLKDDSAGKITFIYYPTDDRKKGAHYYFCRYDLSNFKRINTWKGLGYYDVPNLACGE